MQVVIECSSVRPYANTPLKPGRVDAWPLCPALKQLIGTLQSGFVFHAANGKPLPARNILKRDLHEILERPGIEQAGLHSSRAISRDPPSQEPSA